MMTLQQAASIINAYRANHPKEAHDVQFFMKHLLAKVDNPDDRRTLLHLFCQHLF